MRNCINNCKNHPNTTSFVKRHCKNVSEENMFVLIWKKCTNNCKNHPNTRWHWTKMTWVKIRSCSVWDTDSSNVVTFKHVMWPSVWTLSVRGSALGPVPFPVRNTGKQLWKHEAKSKHGPKPKSHVPTVWLPTVTRHDVTGSWSWTWGWGGAGLVTAKDYGGKMGLREGGVQLTGEELLGPSGCWAGARDVPGCLCDLQESTRTKVTRRPS